MEILAFASIMNRLNEATERMTKQQSYTKRNASSILGDETPNNKNTSKTVPDKPFIVNGKDIYVIDSTTDSDNADVQIVQKSQYEDRSDFLSKTTWPECVGPQHEMLNARSAETSSTTSTYTKSPRYNTRPKSSNPLDHFNYDSRNANKDVSPSGVNSKYSTPRRKLI